MLTPTPSSADDLSDPVAPISDRANGGRVARLSGWVTGDETPRIATLLAWGLLILLTLGSVLATVTWDHNDVPTTGDENSYIIQTLSLAYDGHNLSYDTLDGQRWVAVGFPWMETPQGFFFRTTPEGYTSAKPYGYPLWLAPFVASLGFIHGVAVGNSVLLLGIVVAGVAMLRTRLRGPAVPLLMAAFTFGSALYLYTYAVSVELFFALLMTLGTLGAVRWWRSRAWAWAVLCFVAVGFAAAEKPPLALALLVPAAVIVVSAKGWGLRLGGPAVVAATFLVAVVPYLYYSGGESYTPYAAPRHYASGPIFDQRSVTEFRANRTDTSSAGDDESPFKPAGFVKRITKAPGEIPASAWYYVVGRHTGLLAWTPLCLAAIVAGLWRFRHLDRMGKACLLGIVGTIAFYVVIFPLNYYGGAHSLGNRYFLQASPLVLGVLAAIQWRTRTAVIVSGVALALSLVFLWPQHTQPRSAYLRTERTSAAQELLPFESNQTGSNDFRCPGAYGVRIDCGQPSG